jgi:hypothetical protein
MGEAGALLTNATLLVKLPATVGVKPIENLADCPGGTVNGIVRPLMLKPVPGPAACVTIRLALPELLTVTDWVLVAPTATLPKLTLEGVTEIRGCTPVPLIEIGVGEFAASLINEMLPVMLPIAPGVKLAVKALDWPGARVSGNARPLNPKPLPLTAA